MITALQVVCGIRVSAFRRRATRFRFARALRRDKSAGGRVGGTHESTVSMGSGWQWLSTLTPRSGFALRDQPNHVNDGASPLGYSFWVMRTTASGCRMPTSKYVVRPHTS